ncbi:MAG: hypothetical protein U9P79_07360 [Candidatus Cloacimonadota bacterium]|nr:hypothetical protein [Candidatus Cloacimonadota bacterium]
MIYADKKFNYKKSSISVHQHNQCLSASNHIRKIIAKMRVYRFTLINIIIEKN